MWEQQHPGACCYRQPLLTFEACLKMNTVNTRLWREDAETSTRTGVPVFAASSGFVHLARMLLRCVGQEGV